MIPRELFLNYLKTTRMIRWPKPFPGRNLWITQKYLMWINALISNLNEYFKFTCLIGCKIKIVDRAIYLLTFQNDELNSHLTRMYIWNKQKSAKIRVTCKKFKFITLGIHLFCFLREFLWKVLRFWEFKNFFLLQCTFAKSFFEFTI